MNIRFSGQYSMARVTAKQFNYINSHKGMQSNLLQGGSRKNLLNYLVNVSGERLTFIIRIEVVQILCWMP